MLLTKNDFTSFSIWCLAISIADGGLTTPAIYLLQNYYILLSEYLYLAKGKAIPYGIYEIIRNNGFVNVGISHDTSEFAVESIRRWWKNIGKNNFSHYPMVATMGVHTLDMDPNAIF